MKKGRLRLATTVVVVAFSLLAQTFSYVMAAVVESPIKLDSATDIAVFIVPEVVAALFAVAFIRARIATKRRAALWIAIGISASLVAVQLSFELLT